MMSTPFLSRLRFVVRVLVAGVLAGAVLLLVSLAVGNGRTTAPLAERVTVAIVSGMLYAAVLAPLATYLPTHPRWRRLLSIFVPLYVTGALTDLIEAYFFTTLLTRGSLLAALIIEAIPAFVIALIVASLVPSVASDNLEQALQWRAVRERPIRAWIWRVLLAGALYVPAYYAFAAIVAPIEHPYYSDPAFVAQLQTRTPPDIIIVPLEAIRGTLFVLALLPVLAVMPGRRWSTVIYLTLVGVVIEAVVPLLALTTWPVPMRLGNFGELTADAFARAVFATALVAVPALLRDGVRRPGKTLAEGVPGT